MKLNHNHKMYQHENEKKQKNTIHRECHGKKIMAHLPVNKAPHYKPTCKYEVLSNCL